MRCEHENLTPDPYLSLVRSRYDEYQGETAVPAEDVVVFTCADCGVLVLKRYASAKEADAVRFPKESR